MTEAISTETFTRPVMTAAELATFRVADHGRDYRLSDDGYGDMEVANRQGWSAISGWGHDGWDLGDWPYVVISTRKVGRPLPGNDFAEARPYQMRQTCEGDTTVYAFTSEADRDAAIDYLFIWYGVGRSYDRWVAEGLTYDKRADLDAGTLRVPVQFRGPFTWKRCEG